MTVIQDGNTLWVTKINLLEIIERNNMCNVKVVTSSLVPNMVVLMPGGAGVNGCSFQKDQIDDVIQALRAYKEALPKPCVHAELIKQYAEDCQKYEKPWELWEYLEGIGEGWEKLRHHPVWDANTLYRRKQDLSEAEI